MKIVLDRPAAGYTELATDPTRERTSGVVGFTGYHGLVLFGEGNRPLRIERLEFYGYRVSISSSGRVFGSGTTLEDALDNLLEAVQKGKGLHDGNRGAQD